MTSSGLMRSLRDDHRNLTQLLDLLEREIGHFDRAEGVDYDLISAIAAYCLDYPDKVHHPREDSLLERLRMRDPAAAAKIGDLEGEHRALAALTRRFAATIDDVLLDREIARETVDRVVRDFLAAYRKHMAMEEEMFFPVAEAKLQGTDWAALAGSMPDPDDPLFGVRVVRRFQVLRADILAMAPKTEGRG